MNLYTTTAFTLIILLTTTTPLSVINVHAYSDHPDLFVSAENSLFENHFSGAMVIEVVVRDSRIASLDQQQGEPTVTLNGSPLRMVQGSSGDWYAFFANVDKAKQADQISLTGTAGQNLDFGVFCDRRTDPSVLGTSFSQTDGVAIPASNGITGATQGTASFTACTGNLGTPTNQMNVIRNSPSLNTNSNVKLGQIGINTNAWPLIQLFTFSNSVTIEYDKAGGSEIVNLTYDYMTDLSLKLDRSGYPQGSDVFATINDMQLNEDPTAINSWTFNVNSPIATFYQAFPESGAAPGGSGLVNLYPNLSSLGFKDNGHVEMNLGSVAKLKTNQLQTATSITSGATYNKLVTFVETAPNSGIFESSYASKSTIGILNNAPRFQSASISYNSQSFSILSGTANADLSLGAPPNVQLNSNQKPTLSLVAPNGQFNPGQKTTITLVDSNQNLNGAIIEHLDDFRSSAILPTLKLGNPVTLNSVSNVQFYPSSIGFAGGISVPSNVPDSNSARLIIDTTTSPNGPFKKITLNLGITEQTLKSLFIDVSQPNSGGTNWINYDLRSFQQQLGINSFSDTSMTLYFGTLGNNPVQILAPGNISSGNGLIQITDANVATINAISPSSPAFLEINFDASGSPTNGGAISSETDTQPIVFDLFSFGNQNNQKINNAIYRAELQETSSNSGIFTGTLEYVITNQLNQYDPNLIKSLRTFGQDIKFLVNDQLTDNNAIHLSISGVSASGGNKISSLQSGVQTHTGIVTLDSQSYGLGRPVTITLNDPDLSTDPNAIQTYTTVNDPNSPADDTVGDSSGNILLEVWIKGFRFHHCTVSGVTHGGLAATGFTLTETGPGTGIFKGSFGMPTQICNKDGTALISPTGGSVQVWYHDFRDAFGRSVIVGLSPSSPTQSYPTSTQSSTTQQTQTPYPVISINPQMTDNYNRPLLEKPTVGTNLNFVTQISNNDNLLTKGYSYIIQVKDENDRVVYINLVDGYVNPTSKKTAELSWTPNSTGKYTVEIFVWDKNGIALPLTQKTMYDVEVISK
ncbi:MAG TPA: peptidase [Nitrosopumilaceae archaeon]|nr:peptidase [Nitrosopumilaceae archaeon]